MVARAPDDRDQRTSDRLDDRDQQSCVLPLGDVAAHPSQSLIHRLQARPSQVSFPAMEERILETWERDKIFERSLSEAGGHARVGLLRGPPDGQRQARDPPRRGPRPSRTSSAASRRCGATTSTARRAGTATACRSRSRSRKSSASRRSARSRSRSASRSSSGAAGSPSSATSTTGSG